MEAHLRHLLEELSSAIGRSRDDDREELTRLRSGVERRLSGGGTEEDGPEEHGSEEHGSEEHRSFVESLERAETAFESDHPSLAQAIRQALHLLSSSGI